ncbi:cell division protein ZapA [Maribellus sp. CM-23]|uniref:cell division protein ZapA n=1 Tax=Maribellus sp. CM-23 TaxID=2781026 RepID=UPI001F3BBE22|nr:cell division protein ZapA [Maribellus sp. CM-23]MCE4566911.1 cell division protein ZapA [Maribellus sp. CM-23]
MKDNDFRINIKIDGRNYPLTINRRDEERYRKAAKFVNETITEFRKRFQHNDQQDIMAMTAFQAALNYSNLQERQDYSQFIDDIKDLNDDISDFLKEQNWK